MLEEAVLSFGSSVALWVAGFATRVMLQMIERT